MSDCSEDGKIRLWMMQVEIFSQMQNISSEKFTEIVVFINNVISNLKYY